MASFVKRPNAPAPGATAPQGSWVDVVGQDGYALGAFGSGGTSDVVSMPYCALSFSGMNRFVWTSSTTDPRALQSPDKSFRRSSAWFASPPFTINLTFSSAYKGNLSIYVLDWDSSSRTSTITVGNQTISIPASTNGYWATLPINVQTGTVLSITSTTVGGPNSLIQGIFLGGSLPGEMRISSGNKTFKIDDSNNSTITTNDPSDIGLLRASPLLRETTFKTYSQMMLDDGPLCYIGGDTTSDLTGRGNNGTLVGGMTAAGTKITPELHGSFVMPNKAGTDHSTFDCVSIGPTSDTALAPYAYVDFWCYLDRIDPNDPFEGWITFWMTQDGGWYAGAYYGSFTGGYGLIPNSRYNIFEIEAQGTGASVYDWEDFGPSPIVAPGGPYHIAQWWDGTQARAAINGISADYFSKIFSFSGENSGGGAHAIPFGPVTPVTVPMHLGMTPAFDGRLPGRISDFAIFDKANQRDCLALARKHYFRGIDTDAVV